MLPFSSTNPVEAYLKASKSMIPLVGSAISSSVGDLLPAFTGRVVKHVIRKRRKARRKAKRKAKKAKRRMKRMQRRDPVTGRFVRDFL